MPSFTITQDEPAILDMLPFGGALTLKVTLQRAPTLEKAKTTYPIVRLGKGKRTEEWFERAMAGARPGSVRESELIEVALRNGHVFLEADPHGGAKKTIQNVDLGSIGDVAAVGFTLSFDGKSATVAIDGREPVHVDTFLYQDVGVPVALIVGFPHLDGEGVNRPLVGATVTWEVVEGG